MTTTIEPERTESLTPTRLATFGVVAAVVASIVNVLVRVVALELFDVPSGFGPLGLVPVVNTTVAGVVGATVVYGLLVRTTTRPNRTFAVVAVLVLVVSFAPLVVPPAFLADAPGSVLLTLAAMHVTTAAVVLALLPTATRSG